MTTKFSLEQLSTFCIELYMLLHAGLPTGDAMHSVAEANEFVPELQILANKIDEGESISSCFQGSGMFPKYVCGLIRVGEESGKLEEALKCLGDYYENQIAIRNKVKSVIVYPVLIATLMLIVVGVVLTTVLPMFNSVYSTLGAEMSGVSRVFLELGLKIKEKEYVLWGIVVCILVFILLILLVPAIGNKILQWFQKFYDDKGVSMKLNNAKIAQAVSLGVVSGMTLEDALVLSADLVDGTAKDRCLKCNRMLERGETLSNSITGSNLVPSSYCKMLEIGQRSGFLDESVSRVANTLTEDANTALENMVSRIEPALVLISSVLIGTILLSVVFPLMEVMSSIW